MAAARQLLAVPRARFGRDGAAAAGRSVWSPRRGHDRAPPVRHRAGAVWHPSRVARRRRHDRHAAVATAFEEYAAMCSVGCTAAAAHVRGSDRADVTWPGLTRVALLYLFDGPRSRPEKPSGNVTVCGCWGGIRGSVPKRLVAGLPAGRRSACHLPRRAGPFARPMRWRRVASSVRAVPSRAKEAPARAAWPQVPPGDARPAQDGGRRRR